MMKIVIMVIAMIMMYCMLFNKEMFVIIEINNNDTGSHLMVMM